MISLSKFYFPLLSSTLQRRSLNLCHSSLGLYQTGSPASLTSLVVLPSLCLLFAEGHPQIHSWPCFSYAQSPSELHTFESKASLQFSRDPYGRQARNINVSLFRFSTFFTRASAISNYLLNPGIYHADSDLQALAPFFFPSPTLLFEAQLKTSLPWKLSLRSLNIRRWHVRAHEKKNYYSSFKL